MGFADLVETLRSTSSDVMGRMNVDDFLWVMIQQWAGTRVHFKESFLQGGLGSKE